MWRIAAENRVIVNWHSVWLGNCLVVINGYCVGSGNCLVVINDYCVGSGNFFYGYCFLLISTNLLCGFFFNSYY